MSLHDYVLRVYVTMCLCYYVSMNERDVPNDQYVR